MITDNTAKWQVKSLNTPIANSGDGKLPVGHVYISMGSSAPAGSLPLWGQLFSRSTYKDLWDWVNKHPEQLLSESEWQTKYIENNGLVPFYSEGTDSTNFRVPNCFNLGSDMMDYVVEDGKDSYNWWRIWKSGWVEQGGRLDAFEPYQTKTINFPKEFKDITYHIDFTQGYVGNLYAAVINQKTTSFFQVVNSSNTGGRASWEARGYTNYLPKTERVLWCVKAFGNIDEGTGSTSLDSIATNITQLNTKVDNWVSGTLDSHATAIAEMQSYFNGNFEKTLLYGNDGTFTNANQIVLKDSWKNYDGLMFNFFYDDAAYRTFNGAPILWKWDFEEQIRLANINPTGQGRVIRYQINDIYMQWQVDANVMPSELVLTTNGDNCGIASIYGIKLKANGITNKSAIDVSQISGKISSLLTSDNHLRLPSGLEVW